MEIDLGIELGGSSTTTSPQLLAPFSVPSSGFVGGGSLEVRPLEIPVHIRLTTERDTDLDIGLGVRGTALGFSNSGSAIFLPTDERFTAGINSMETVDGKVTLRVKGPVAMFKANYIEIDGFFGAAWGQTTVSSPDASVDKTLSGHSHGVGVKVPIQSVLPGALPNMPGTLLGFQWRHYNISGDVLLFGPSSAPVHVDQKGDIFTGTLTVPIDASNFFNTGSANHELKYGAGYRGAGR